MKLRKSSLVLLIAVGCVCAGYAATASAQQLAGVEVDPAGVLRTKVVADPSGRLTRQRLEQMRVGLNPDVAKPSPMRKISLVRLERELALRMASGQAPTDDMRYLAGLTRVRYVFYFPEIQDIVIAGPAEGYGLDLTGRPVGIETGQSVLELQDLIVALRAYAPQAEGIRVISCSIDPTQEGLRQMQEFWQSLPGSAALRDSRAIAQGMRDSLGLHTVTIRGVSPKTHFAQVLVEADYRMKLIGIGLEQPPVNIPSYVSKASPRSATANGMQRWYFTPNYETVRVSDDRHAMELVGEGVKLINENELVQGDGSRVESSLVDRASQLFVKAFTEKYPELARRSPVFGQLRNLIDLSIAAAYIHEQDWFGKAGWKMSVFADEKAYPVESYTAPTQVETAVNVIWKGNRLMTPIGGGVNIQPTKALSTDNVMADDNGQLGQLQNGIDIKALQDGQWWWD